MIRLATLAALAFLASSCTSSGSKTNPERGEEVASSASQPVVDAPADTSMNQREAVEEDHPIRFGRDNAAMNAAEETAQATIGKFLADLADPNTPTAGHRVKYPFTDDNGVEHMWCSLEDWDEENFLATVDNMPRIVQCVEYGEQVLLPINEVSDWMYIDTRTRIAYGAYTLRVMRDSMSPEDRAKFDREFPFKFAEE